MAEIADVLASYGLRVEPGAPGSLDARVIELVERCEELRTRLESAEEALRFYANLENWTPVFCKCQQHPCPMHTDQGWRARAALGAAGEEQAGG